MFVQRLRPFSVTSDSDTDEDSDSDDIEEQLTTSQKQFHVSTTLPSNSFQSRAKKLTANVLRTRSTTPENKSDDKGKPPNSQAKSMTNDKLKKPLQRKKSSEETVKMEKQIQGATKGDKIEIMKRAMSSDLIPIEDSASRAAKKTEANQPNENKNNFSVMDDAGLKTPKAPARSDQRTVLPKKQIQDKKRPPEKLKGETKLDAPTQTSAIDAATGSPATSKQFSEAIKTEIESTRSETAAQVPSLKQVPPSPKVYIRKIKGKGKVKNPEH